MLHYKGLISSEPWITIKPSADKDMDTSETLGFYDDEIPQKYCQLLKEKLQTHYNEEALIQVYYEKDKNIVVIEITKYFDKNKDLDKQISNYKSSFEEYYNKIIHQLELK